MCSVFGLFWFQLMMMKGESMQTSVRSLLLRAVRSRAAGVAVALLAALGIVVQGLAAPAAADVNPQIEVKNLSLTKINSAEEEQGGALIVDNLALLKFDWDASKTTPKAGDSFTITLPEQLDFHSTLERPIHYDEADVDLGKCTIDGKTVTCTFDERITPLVQAGNKNIRGTGKFQLAAKKSTTQEELPFVINGDKAGKTVQVDLPGTGGITVGQSKYNPDKRIYKGYTGLMKEGDTKATWFFHFGGSSLQNELGKTFDGHTVQTITFKDTLGAGMKCPLQSVILYAVDSEENPSQSFELDNGLESGPKTTDQGAFEVTGKCEEMAPDGTTPITFKATGPFRAKTNYMVSYSTLFTGDDGKVLPGTEYTNTVSADGTTITSTNTVSFVAAGSVSVSMDPGEGAFSITKKIASDYANQVNAGATFTVTFDYELPATANQYPKWKPPANSLSADQRTGTATMKVTRGVASPAKFPTGTKISKLREDTSTANSALPDGYVWKDPKFTIGSTPTTSLTIEDQKVTKIDLLNTVGVGNRFQVVKKASGAEGAAAKKFSFSYTCTLPNTTTKNGQITDVPGDGTPVPSPEKFPVGTTCKVTEDTAGAGIDGYTLDAAGHDAQTVTIGQVSEPTVTATFTNTYTRDTGRFSVTKAVAGDAGDKAPASYTFDYTCKADGKDPMTGTIVVGKGESKESGEIPVGYSCSVKERVDQGQDGTAYVEGYTLDVTTGADVTIAKGAVSNIDVTNTYTRDTGRFSVTKKVAGDAGDKAPAKYTFDYTCKADGKDPMTGTIVVGKGESKNSDEIPVGYSCSVKERVDRGQDGTAYVEGYTLDVTATPAVTIAKGAVSNIGVTNTYTLNKGTFSVKKVVEGATFTGADNDFTVQYTCTHNSVDLTDEQKAGSLTLEGNGAAVTSPSLPFGTSCTIKEADGSAQRAGYAVATDYTAGQVTVGTATPSPEVTVTNTYTPLEGGFDISKTVDGDGAALAKDTQFTFDYTCTPLTGAAQVKGTVVVKGGENRAVTDVPVGSCSVSERDATINGASLNTVLTVDGSSDGVNNGTAVFNVKDGVTVKVAATNTYVLDRGSFSVAKKVVGGADSFTKDTFVFDYVCTDGTQGRLDVPGDGTAVEGPRVPTGTECTVTERAQTANRDGYTVTSELSDNGKVTISQKDAVVAVTATNTYTPVPKVPSKQLAKTGASNVAVVGVVGSLLVVVGGVLIALKRRRNDA